MVKTWHTEQLALCGAVVLMVAGCGKTQPDIPANFCHVPVDNSVLAPLVPNGDSLEQKYTPFESHPGAQCDLSVDGHGVLSVAVMRMGSGAGPDGLEQSGVTVQVHCPTKSHIPGTCVDWKWPCGGRGDV